jgi:hypothetical protein
MAASSWYSMRIYYYDTNKDDLLLDCIRPLLTQLQERKQVTRAYFMRHWEGGSHLRLNMFTDERVFQQEIVSHVKSVVEGYLSTHPSTATFTEQEALQQYERRANMVLETLTYTPPVPNNSVIVTPYEILAEKVGSQGAAALLEDYYVETNELAFKIIEQTRNNMSARVNASFDQLVARAATASFLPIKQAYMSYRSHTEAYIVCEPQVEDPDKRRQRLMGLYQVRKTVIERRTRRLLAQICDAPEQLPGWLSEVIAIHRRYDELALQGINNGVVTLKSLDEKLLGPTKENRLIGSSFHNAAANNQAVRIYNAQPGLLANRAVLNFLYLHLIRTGMLNEYRYILDYYIAEVIEEIFNISPVDILTRFKGPVKVGQES